MTIKEVRPRVSTSGQDVRIEISERKVTEQLTEYTIHWQSETPVVPERCTIAWEHPLVRSHHWWTPAGRDLRRLVPWEKECRFSSRACTHAPVLAVYDTSGRNAVTFAHDDPLHVTELGFRVVEETACALCFVTLFCEPLPARTAYTLILRVDHRSLPWYHCLRDVSTWWEGLPGLEPMPVPESARLPMYSTWYSFHQALSPEAIETQCRLARELGMDAVIVDDGWQTDDNHRGYSHCGDWEVCAAKFPDFKSHVSAVQAMGMKYMLWFSVPFVGIRSKAYERFKGKYLDDDEQRYWYVLDPRFPEVREYLIGIYERFARDYGIDGFKLDFVDQFRETPYSAARTGEGRDIASVSVAADRLLTDIRARLVAINPDVLIEFRQAYIGPLMRKYGNMFRANDVPNDFAGNRMETIDVRLLCGHTAAHADMMMWHPDEPVESAAMQLIHALFAVPQISVKIETLPDEHRAMLAFYLSFWREHRDVLLDGELMPRHPEQLYTMVSARTDDKWLAVVFAGDVVKLPESLPSTLLIINGTMHDGIAVEGLIHKPAYHLTIRDCTGRVVNRDDPPCADLFRLPVPPAGIAIIERLAG